MLVLEHVINWIGGIGFFVIIVFGGHAASQGGMRRHRSHSLKEKQAWQAKHDDCYGRPHTLVKGD